MSGYEKRRVLRDFDEWVNTEYEHAGHLFKTIDWIHSLSKDICLILNKLGYQLYCSNYAFGNYLLNYAYHIDNLVNRRLPNKYESYYAKNPKYDADDMYFFEQYKFTDDIIQKLKNEFRTDYLCDDYSEFSYTWWYKLRNIVFCHIDLDKSPASEELYYMHNLRDDDSDVDDGANNVSTIIDEDGNKIKRNQEESVQYDKYN